MAYQRKTWRDRQSEYPNRRKLSPVADAENIFAVERDEGLVVEVGDLFDQTTMNALEGRVEDAFAELTNGTTKAAKAVEADNATKVYGKEENALSVNYAASAGEVAWGKVSGKPSLASTVTYTATIDTTATQNIVVDGILATDNPMVDVVLSGDIDADIAILDSWSLINRLTTYNGGITVACYEQPPAVAIPIQIKVVR